VPVEQRRPNVAAAFTKNDKDKVILDRFTRDKPTSYHVQEVIDQRISTTILMHHVKQQGKDAVIAHLQQKFTEGLSLLDKLAVDEKICQLRSAIKAQGGKRAVLLNRRTGDLNKQHNTTEGIDAQLQALAAQKSLFVIGIATPRGKPGDIDLFDSDGKSQAKQKFVDKRRTAYFWKKVSELQLQHEVHGLIGGRSGSMDIAAFMGVNAFSWDEYNQRDEQVLRLLQTYPLMHIGYVAPDKKNKEGSYEGLDFFPLNTWLSTGRSRVRPPPVDENHIQGLEGAGYRAHYLRDAQS